MNKNTAKAVAFGLALGLVLPFAGILRANEMQHANMDPAKRLEQLTKEYTLTADQQTQTKKLLEDKKQKMDAVKKAMDEARDAFHSQFRALLTPDQQKAWDNREAKEKMEHKEGKMEKKMEKMEKK